MKTFQNEYEYLVHLLRCALQEQQPEELPKKLSFQKVFHYGKLHEVANIAFLSIEKLERKPEAALLKEWKTAHALSIQRHANQMLAHAAITAALDDAGIRHMEVQGTKLKPLYPQPYWRMMSDIDYIIDKENLDAAQAVLAGLGYETKNPNGVEIDGANARGVFVELHSDFFAPTSVCYGSITDPFSYAVCSQGCAWEASQTIIYLYTLLHCVKHFLQNGTGIRRIMDLHILQKQVWHQVDQPFVSRVLRESGYEATARQLLAVADKWFAGTTPAQGLRETETLIFGSNNHGTFQVSLKNEFHNTAAEDQRFFKLKKYRALLFPPKADIYRAYPRCARWRLPAPLCWVYRWVSICFRPKKRRESLQLLSNISKTKLK